ncbi:MAG: hypothetical protein KatS3mg129_0490 [Leptospiraceae bacterium]|nr:MAG: hypothetical protein KatS3mg129_0490 [Leptospiraceae bacterium]
MKIYINDEPVDIQLENEKTFKDLYQSMQAEVQKHNKFIVDFRFDIKDSVDFISKDIDQLTLDKIENVYFYIGDLKEMIISTLHTQIQYIDDIGSTLFESEQLTQEEINNLKDGTKWIKEVINIISTFFVVPLHKIQVKMPEKNYENLKEHLNKFTKLIKKLNVENYPDIRQELIQTLRVIRAFTFQYLNQLLSNHLSNEELLSILEKFDSQIEKIQNKLIEINTNLQTGNDKIAMEILQDILQKLELYFFVLMSTSERFKDQLEENFLELLKELLTILEDLSSALMEMDIVAVGDILEYELNDKLSIIKEYIPKLKKLLTGSPILEK